MTIAQLQSILESIDDKDLEIYSEFCFAGPEGPFYVTEALFGARRTEDELIFIGLPRNTEIQEPNKDSENSESENS